MSTRLVDIATAYATQTTTEKKGKSEWVVYNTDQKEIYRLPGEWSEKQVMTAIHFAREFETIAFNKGINFQKSKNPKTIKTLQQMVMNLTTEKKVIMDRNEVLANEIDKLNIELNKLTF